MCYDCLRVDLYIQNTVCFLLFVNRKKVCFIVYLFRNSPNPDGSDVRRYLFLLQLINVIKPDSYEINKARRMSCDAFPRAHAMVSYPMYRYCCPSTIERWAVPQWPLSSVSMNWKLSSLIGGHPDALHYASIWPSHSETRPKWKMAKWKLVIASSWTFKCDVRVCTCRTRFDSPVFCDNCFKSFASGFWLIAK